MNDNIPDYELVKDGNKLNDLAGYEIEAIRSEDKVTHFFLRRKVSDDEYKFRLLMIMADGKRFMTREY
jgi:hypothetical protein